ncbi:MAG: uracil-DNA glycosylase family protein [Fusobacteriaceae bacterium]
MDMENLWEELIFEIGSLGPLVKAGDKKVFIGSGNRQADILFVGDEPDLYLDEELRVNSGSSGEFLFKLCDIVGMTPEDYYVSTLTKSNLKYKDYFDNDQEHLLELLNMQIALINPKVVVALGQGVASALLLRDVEFLKEKGKIMNWMGDVKFFITYDPNFAKKSRDAGGKKSPVAVEFWNDLKILKNYIEQ